MLRCASRGVLMILSSFASHHATPACQHNSGRPSLSVRCASSFNFTNPTKRERSNSSSREQHQQPRNRPRQQWQQADRRQQQQRQQWRDRPQEQTWWEPDQQQQQRGSSRRPRVQEENPTERYQHQYLVTCHPGLEKVTAADLQECCQREGLAAEVHVTAPGRIALGCDSQAAGYVAVLNLRSATRVLQLIHQQQLDPSLPAGSTVYEATREAADWCDLLMPQQTFGLHCLHFYNNSNVTNSQLVQRRVRDAVCDAVRDARGVRPAPPQGTPDLPLAFQMLNDNLQLYRDVGGGSLHRRGYRSESAVHKAALNEAAAAGLLLIAGWQHTSKQEGAVVIDPMCGSGTLLIEAALISTDTAPGLLRDTRANPWPFLHWPDSQRQLWKELQQSAQQRAGEGAAAQRKAGGGSLLGNDCHAGALRLAAQSAAAAGVSDLITLHQGQCGDWQLPPTTAAAANRSEAQEQPQRLVVCNPPWGLRLMPGGGGGEDNYQQQQRGGGGGYRDSRDSSRGNGGGGRFQGQQQHADEDDAELVDAWQQLSHFLKQQCAGADAWVLSGNPEASRHLGMRASTKRAVRLGGQKAMWLQYSIRSGNRSTDRNSHVKGGDGGDNDGDSM